MVAIVRGLQGISGGPIFLHSPSFGLLWASFGVLWASFGVRLGPDLGLDFDLWGSISISRARFEPPGFDLAQIWASRSSIWVSRVRFGPLGLDSRLRGSEIIATSVSKHMQERHQRSKYEQTQTSTSNAEKYNIKK